MMCLLSGGEYRTLRTKLDVWGERVPERQWFDGTQWYITEDNVLVSPYHVVTLSGWKS